jgi:hypothetical protein
MLKRLGYIENKTISRLSVWTRGKDGGGMEGIPNILGFIDSSVQECLHEGGGGGGGDCETKRKETGKIKVQPVYKVVQSEILVVSVHSVVLNSYTVGP